MNPGAFHGQQKDFLLGEKAAYTAGVDGGYTKDTIALIQRRYLKCFPIDLPHDQELTAEHLQAVKDDEPEPEHTAPDDTKMGPEEYEAAVKAFEERQKLLKFRKGVSCSHVNFCFSGLIDTVHASKSNAGSPTSI